MTATVVIPTRNRPEDLRRCLAAVGRQRTGREYEVVVVDDGSSPPVDPSAVGGARVVRLDGRGLSMARNAGIEAAHGSVVAFVDDDVEPDPGWLEAALSFLERHPDHVGAEGPVRTPPYDPLRGKSVEVSSPGTYRGCNVAYRRTVLERIGGYASDIPRQGEDLDVGLRARALGPIGWEPQMRVTHYPRALSFLQLARRARDAPIEVRLFQRHRSHFGRAAKLPAYLFPYANIAVAWARIARAELPSVLARPVRLVRLIALPVAQAVFATQALAASVWGRRSGARRYQPPPGPPR